MDYFSKLSEEELHLFHEGTLFRSYRTWALNFVSAEQRLLLGLLTQNLSKLLAILITGTDNPIPCSAFQKMAFGPPILRGLREGTLYKFKIETEHGNSIIKVRSLGLLF
ncbi:MAG: hypothetical protein LRY71_14445 [Bacillaceae bacterium]|nr:hypothetical protein [Bacillaceae bacterium]